MGIAKLFRLFSGVLFLRGGNPSCIRINTQPVAPSALLETCIFSFINPASISTLTSHYLSVIPLHNKHQSTNTYTQWPKSVLPRKSCDIIPASTQLAKDRERWSQMSC